MALRSLLNQVTTRKVVKIPSYLTHLHRTYSREMSGKGNIIDFENLNDKVMKRDIVLVDVREPAELRDDGKIPNSVNIPLGQVTEVFNMPDSSFLSKFGVPKPGESDPFVISCRSGKRATDAYQKLQALGYKNALIYSGSFQDWVKNGGIVEK